MREDADHLISEIDMWRKRYLESLLPADRLSFYSTFLYCNSQDMVKYTPESILNKGISQSKSEKK